jgi:hypothetical protein
MNVHIIDDREFYHIDYSFKLERVGFKGDVSTYFSLSEFFKKTSGTDLSKDLVVVDFELGQEFNPIKSNFTKRLRCRPKKLVLCSALKDFGLHSNSVFSEFDLVVSKQQLDWSELISG